MNGVRRADGYFEGVGGLRLRYRTWEVDRPRAGLIVVHGLFEHSGRYRELGERLATHGYSTFALDLRGHGASEGRRGHVRRFPIFLQDVDRFRREVQGLLPVNLPLFLIGHSMGGLVAVRYLEEYDVPFHGAVISAPWLATAVPVPALQMLAARALDRTLPAFPFPFHLNAHDLSHDEERVADYRDDPTIHTTLTPRLFTEVTAAMEAALSQGDRISVPVLFLLAGDDRIADTDASLAFAEALTAEDVTVEVLEGMFHEVLQERDRPAVVARIAEWIGARAS